MIAAYILNKEYTTKEELLTTLCSLSYAGDTRMKFAENPNKVNNIVNASYDELIKIYDFNTDCIRESGIKHLKIDLNMIRYYSPLYPLALRKYLNYNTDKEKIFEYLMNLNKKKVLNKH